MRAILLFITFIGLVSAHLFGQEPLIINELMGKNDTTIMDIDGDYSDWLELYNTSPDTISLNGFYLTDKINNPYKFRLPDIGLASGEHLLIFVSGKNQVLGGEVHANFKINPGEFILLKDSLGTTRDSVFFNIAEEDLSLARQTDGDPVWVESITSTPGFANSTSIYPRIIFSQESGVYTDSVVLELSSTTPGIIHYTTDGSQPTILSPIYTGPLVLYDKSSEPNVLGNIPSSVVFDAPTSNVEKINVIRTALFENYNQITKTYNQSYLIDVDYDFAVVSVCTDYENVFSVDSGFYVPGNNPGSPPWYISSNFYQSNFEVPTGFTFIDTNGSVLSQNVGMKLHGGLTRTYSKKSLKIVARSEYGEGELNYPFFGSRGIDEYDRLVLRNGGQDLTRAMVRDAFASRLTEDLNMITMKSRPVIVFLNGEYWGIHMLRDKIDEHHLENLYGIDKDSVDILQSNADIIEGGSTEYLDLLNYVSNNSLTYQPNYDYVKSKINIQNFTDYFITQIYFNNREWPHNNIKYYKEHAPEGKWNWILFDLDITAGAWSACKADKDAYLWMSDTIGYPAWSRVLFVKLSENQEFRNYFSNRFADLKNTIFNPGYNMPILQEMVDELSLEIDKNFERWDHIPSTQDWLNRVGVLQVFLQNRNNYIWDQTQNFYNLGNSTVEVLLNSNAEGAGNINFSTLNHSMFPWNGTYYKTTEIELSVQANPGYEFSHWLESGDTSSVLMISLENDTSFTAIFQPTTFVTDDLIINEVHSKNRNDLVDSIGNSPDWIELYNKGTTIIDLNYFYLTDNINKKCKWKISLQDSSARQLGPGEYISFYADSDTLSREFHTNFSIASTGEGIYLYQVFGVDTLLTDSMYITERITDVSYGRYPDGTGTLRNFVLPTFTASNEVKVFQSNLFLNEIAGNNQSGLSDSAGVFVDWLEVYNAESNAVNLSGYFLSDDTLNLTRWKIPINNDSLLTVDSLGFKIFFADGETQKGASHLPFKLNSEGESVILSFLDDQELVIIDEISYSNQPNDFSTGRYPDGSESIYSFFIRTPEKSNILVIDTIQEYDLKLYPNPTQDYLILENDFSTNEMLSIYNVNGQLAHQQLITNNVEQIDILSLSAGLYILRVQGKIFKFVKREGS